MNLFKWKMKNFFKKSAKIWILLIIASLLTFGFTIVKDKEFEIIKNLDIFYALFRELNLFYVDETNPKELIEDGINGMLKSLDPYTTFIPEEEQDDFSFMTTGEYGGIGALIRKGGEYTVISEPYEGFPAQKAGLKAGDTLLLINGVSTRNKEISEVSEMLKGKPNTGLKLKISRLGEKRILEKNLIREQVSIPNIPYYGKINNDVGYIRLSGFTKDAGIEARDALKKLIDMGITSLILDLRGNPGGMLMESVNVANLFVKKDQEIVSTKGKVKQWDNSYKTNNHPIDTNLPLVILVNRISASASEIVAGAMQDLDRAVIVGQRTFGKGLVQTTRSLSYNTQLKITTAKYYIPSGRCIQAVDYSHRNEDGSVGLIPDSVIREFRTRNGRIVFDGGGISPDIFIEPDQPGSITISLYTKNLIFDYATYYSSLNESYKEIDNLVFTDEDYQGFLNFIKDKTFDYTTESDNKLNELIEVAKKEKYFYEAENEFNILKKRLSHDKEKDLQTFREEIKNLINEEIASRYYYQKGRIRASLNEDKELDKAVEICENQKLYNMIRKGMN
jgi:carboxyl-terminal processing protease